MTDPALADKIARAMFEKGALADNHRPGWPLANAAIRRMLLEDAEVAIDVMIEEGWRAPVET